MLKMILGVKFNDANKLNEEFSVSQKRINANINENKILKIINEFVDMQEEPLFIIMELPTKKENENFDKEPNKFHKDVYYIDNLSNEKVKEILKLYGNLFVNDGLAQIGVGNHLTDAEIMTDKYNVVTIYNGKDDITKYCKMLENNNIIKVDKLITAWNFFSKESPGESGSIQINGKGVYDALEALRKDTDIYFSERREDI